MSDMKFGEDWKSSFGEEDVLTDCGRTHERTHGRTDRQKFTRWWWSVNHDQSFKFLGKKKTAQDYIPIYSRPLSGAAKNNNFTKQHKASTNSWQSLNQWNTSSILVYKNFRKKSWTQMDKTKRSNSKCTAEAQKSHCSGRQVNKDSNTKNFSNADNASFKPGDHTS